MRMTIKLLSIASIVHGYSDPYFYAFGIEFRRRPGGKNVWESLRRERSIRVLSRFGRYFRLDLKFRVMYVFFDDSSNKSTTIGCSMIRGLRSRGFVVA
jgi:hypothetical protein